LSQRGKADGGHLSSGIRHLASGFWLPFFASILKRLDNCPVV
jgi:hypothetical protein